MNFRDEFDAWLNRIDPGDLSRCRRGTSPVANWKTHQVVRSIETKEFLWFAEGNPKIREEFIRTYRRWITDSSSFVALGIGAFEAPYYANGVTEGYDIFFREHAGRRFRVFKGEYPYTALSVSNWTYIEEDEIRPGDAVLMSVPFYAHGGVPQGAEEVLKSCAELDVPVFIDAAYFGTCYRQSFDYGHPAIEMVGFSLSKAFNVQSFRIGLLLARKSLPYLEEIQVAANYFNKVGAYVGLKLMESFSADYMPEAYRRRHQMACYRLGLLPSSCIMLGNLRAEDDRFDTLLEDHRFEAQVLPPHTPRRVCISGYISDPSPTSKRILKRALSEARRA